MPRTGLATVHGYPIAMKTSSRQSGQQVKLDKGKSGMKRLFYFLILLFSLIALIFPYQMISAGSGGKDSTSEEASVSLTTASLSWSISYPEVASSPRALLRSASGRMIEFSTQNGLTLNGKPAVKRTIPSFVLYRNGALTGVEERTAMFKLTGLPPSSMGINMRFQILTQHSNPDQGLRGTPILVAEKSYTILPEEINETLVITHTFGAQLDPDQGNFATPTDYLQVHIQITDSSHPDDNPLVDQIEEYAMLLENQWVYTFTGLNEDETGAAPNELVVYYCDMFPFQKDVYDPSSRLSRAEIRQFVEAELGPQMAGAVVAQTNLWGFSWSQAWTSYRGGEDTERLSVALTMPGEWFHGRAPGAAHSGISILTSHEDYKSYSTLNEGMMGIFHHELFHNIQRNINQKMGSDGNIDGDSKAWAYFTEGMAIMASSVGQPNVEFRTEGSYLRQANSFMAGNKFEGNDLNTSYADLNPYRGAFYWRFLYEECGGLSGETEDPAKGMQIIRETLVSLYSLEEEEKQLGLVELLPEIMDRSIAATPGCPFKTYQESLTHFARRIYSLRTRSRNCPKCAMYDPEEMYAEPPTEVVVTGEAQESTFGELRGSYGMDFIEIELEAGLLESPLRIGFSPAASTSSVFNVQLVRANEETTDGLEILAAETIASDAKDGEAIIYLESGEEIRDVALIITRIDAEEAVDSLGAYSVSLR